MELPVLLPSVCGTLNNCDQAGATEFLYSELGGKFRYGFFFSVYKQKIYIDGTEMRMTSLITTPFV